MTSDGGCPTASINDPRLTKWGKWLRRYKLDELPTLWNLIKRDINICGCRPDTVEEIDTLNSDIRDIVLSIRPGIISPATLWNRYEDETLSNKENPHEYYTKVIKPVKYFLNVWYVNNKSLWLDTRIILAYIIRTIGFDFKFLKIYPPKFGVWIQNNKEKN